MIKARKIDIDKILKELLGIERIKARVYELKLTKEQMIDAIPVMIDMKNQNIESSEYLITFYLTKTGSIQRTELLSDYGKKNTFIKNIVTNNIYPMSFNPDEVFEKDNLRKTIVNEFVRYINGDAKKGMYIYGPMGIGKTFILKRFARKLAEEGNKVGFISVPTLVSKVKGTFNSNEKYERLANTLKTVDYLFIDDIGAEVISAWFRDEFLFSILNERMDKKLITFFSSNYTFEELEKIESKTTKQKYRDFDKSARLIDRVKTLSKEFLLKGKNRRY